jgi:hypothetical protein
MTMTKLYPLSCFIRYRAAVARAIVNQRIDALAKQADIDIAQRVAHAIAEVWR